MKILAFGIAKDIVGSHQIAFPVKTDLYAEDLKTLLFQKYPGLSDLPSLAISVNLWYAEAGTLIHPQDEVALIPPVSGG